MAAVRTKTDPKFILLCLMAAGSVLWMWATFFNTPSTSTSTGQTSTIAAPAPVADAKPLTQADHVANGDTAPFQLIGMVKETVGASLRDPDSARYSQVGAYTSAKEEGTVHFCGVVNAKNGFGGYNGARHFIAVPGVKVWFQGIAGFAKTYRDLCRPAYLIKEVPVV